MKKQRHESTSPLQQQYRRGEKRRTGRTTTTAATNRTTGSSTMDTGTRRRRPFSSFFKGWSTRLVQTNTTTSFKRGTIHEPREDPSSHEHTEPGDISPYDQHDFRRHQSLTRLHIEVRRTKKILLLWRTITTNKFEKDLPLKG
jgi:hypothetical protein